MRRQEGRGRTDGFFLNGSIVGPTLFGANRKRHHRFGGGHQVAAVAGRASRKPSSPKGSSIDPHGGLSIEPANRGPRRRHPRRTPRSTAKPRHARLGLLREAVKILSRQTIFSHSDRFLVIRTGADGHHFVVNGIQRFPPSPGAPVGLLNRVPARTGIRPSFALGDVKTCPGTQVGRGKNWSIQMRGDAGGAPSVRPLHSGTSSRPTQRSATQAIGIGRLGHIQGKQCGLLARSRYVIRPTFGGQIGLYQHHSAFHRHRGPEPSPMIQPWAGTGSNPLHRGYRAEKQVVGQLGDAGHMVG